MQLEITTPSSRSESANSIFSLAVVVQADSEESAHKTTKQIYEITSLLVEFFRRIVEGGNAKEQWYYKITNSQNYGDCNHPSQIIVLT